MLTLTRKVDYAMIAVAHLCAEAGRLSSAREIANHYEISERLVANILKDLARAGIVSSVRGAKGGYQVTRPPQEINVRMLYEALQGDFQFAPCTGETEEHACDTWECCPAKHKVQHMHSRIRELLESVNFGDLLASAEAAHGSGAPPAARGGRGPMQV